MQDSPSKFFKRNVNPKRIMELIQRGKESLKEDGFEATWRKVHFRINLMLKWDVWQFRSDIPLQKDLAYQRAMLFDYMPKISIVVPLYNTPQRFLMQMIKSVKRQSYANWELVMVDASSFWNRHPLLKLESLFNRKIVYKRLGKNGGIAANTTAATELCTGDYYALLDHDDVILPNALYENIKAINHEKADMLYCDEITLDGRLKHLIQFHFKVDYAPDFLRGVNYITHFLVFNKELFEQAGAYLDSKYDGAQDYDLILRLSEKAKKIYHIPQVLYYWRGHKGSTASDMSTKQYAFEAGRKAIAAHLERIGLKAQVQIQHWPGSYRIKYDIIDDPLVSVIIPNKDKVVDLERCLSSLYEKKGWENLEVVIVENNSRDKRTFAYYELAKQKYENLRIVYYKGSFNFSSICNFGEDFARGEHILLLNNDVEILSENFVTEMLMYSQRADVGAVGAKLYYPDNTLQHAGVIMGINGSAGHSHKGLAWDTTGDMYRLVTPQNYLAVTGACLMVKRKLFDANLMDERNFAVAYNDIDFCLRLYEQGYVNVFTPYSEAYHFESKTRGPDTDAARAMRYEGEKSRFASKWQKYFNYGDPYYNPHFTLQYENYGYK
ncbi:MAG: glycosyltransferase family 2 protein [Oscillospiraceae bacterium]